MAVKCSNRTLWTTGDEDGYSYWVEFEDRSFTKGSSKFMYKGRLNGKGPRLGDYCTLKVLKNVDIAKHEDWDLYINRAKRANELAAQFNKMIDNQYKVKFLVPMLGLIDISSTCTDCIYFMSNTKRIRSDDCVAVEPYIGRKFRKFYPNSPLKGAEHAYILQAFSHFTASQTGDMLICGLQGVARGTEFYLTNPLIHSANREWGPKDQGPQGFRDFFASHTCNSICQSMDLPEYLETTAAAAPVPVAQRIDDVDGGVETTPKNIISDSTDSITQEVAHSDAESLQETKVTTLETSSERPSILQTPPMSRAGRTIVAPVSMEISVSRSSSVVGPPSFAEDVPGESICRPPAESEILDATPIDDIATQLSEAQDVVPPPSSEYVGPLPPCSVTDYLELQKNFASFSPGSESIPMIDDELAGVESEMPLPSEDFEPTMSPSLNSYLKDKESLEIIPHGIMDLDMESQPSTSVFEDNVPIPVPAQESLVNTPCGTTSQESLVTTPCGTIPQEIGSQPSIVSTPKDEVCQNMIPVSEAPIEPELHLDLQQGTESSHDVESEVCLVSIPPDCMDHHLDTLESLEAMSPASEKLQSVETVTEAKWPPEETGGVCVEPDAEPVAEEQISAQEFPETETIQETGAENFENFPTDNVEDEVQKSVCMDNMSDFKQSLETIPEGSTESDSAQSLENEILAPEEVSTVVPESVDDAAACDSTGGTVVEDQTVGTTTESSGGQGEMIADTTSEFQSAPTPEAAVTDETVVEPTSENVAAESATEIQTEGAQETTVEPVGEAVISPETAVEPVGEAVISPETAVEAAAEPVISPETAVEAAAEPVGEAMESQETAVEASAESAGEATVETTAEPVGETAISQETSVEPAGEATMSQEATVETTGEAMATQETAVEGVGETTMSQETTVETSAEPVCEPTMSQETTVSQEAAVETSAEPVEETTMSQETTVETSAEPTMSQEATVETTAEPVEEATMSQETTVETSAEPVGETTMSQEATVETTAEPVGEATMSQEATVEGVGEATMSQEATVEGVGEATMSQETTVETCAEPVGEAVSEETAVESAGERSQGQEMAEPIVQETAMEEATVSQDTVTETKEEANIETKGDAYVSQDTIVESSSAMPAEGDVGYGSSVEPAGEVCVNQEATVVENTEESNEGLASQEVATESTVETTGEGYVCQDTGAASTAGEAVVTQETTTTTEVAGECIERQSTVGTSGEGYVCQESGFGSTVESAGEGYVCPESAVETTVESVGQDVDSNVEMTADGYTSQDSGFGSVVDANPTGYPDQDQGTSGAYDSEPVTTSYPAEVNNTQISDSFNYGVPPEYTISEDCRSSQCEAGCPQTYTKMTIVPDLDTMEYVETKRLDSVCEEHDTQQGIETLPRRRIPQSLSDGLDPPWVY